MPKITFTVDADKTHFAPELIAALKASDENTDLSPLYEKYGVNTVVDAMFAIEDNVHPDSEWWRMSEDRVEEWLWEDYDENCFPYIVSSFLDRHNADKLYISHNETEAEMQ